MMNLYRQDGVPLGHGSFHRTLYKNLVGRITNHNQNTTTGVAKSSYTNSTVSLGGMASCCNLQRERN